VESIHVSWTPGGQTGQLVDPGVESLLTEGVLNATKYEFTVTAVDSNDNVSDPATAIAVPTINRIAYVRGVGGESGEEEFTEWILTMPMTLFVFSRTRSPTGSKSFR
jgi:hypothetical protein